MPRWNKLQYILVAALALLWIAGCWEIFSERKQWDFKTYYYSAVAHERGLDPYDLTISEKLAGEKVTLTYVYPPLTLWFFRIFALFEYRAAYIIFLFLKIVLLIALLLLWRRFVFENTIQPLFLWFVTLAFSSTAYWDILSGNIGVFEQLIFWVGMTALLQKRMILFVAAIVLVSCFKLTFIVFLVLPLLWRQRDAIKSALIGISVFFVYVLGNFVLQKQQTQSFIKMIAIVDERGEAYNHSLLAMVRDFFDQSASANLMPQLPVVVAYLVYAAIAAAILTVAWKAHSGRSRSSDDRSIVEIIMLACLTYVLVMPRMKSYSFILLIPPAYYVIRNCIKPEAFIYLFALISLTKWTPLAIPGVIRFLWWYYPWLLALMIWILFVRYFNSIPRNSKTIVRT